MLIGREEYSYLRRVQSTEYSSTINDFFKTNKMADRRNLNTNEIALEKTKLL